MGFTTVLWQHLVSHLQNEFYTICIYLFILVLILTICIYTICRCILCTYTSVCAAFGALHKMEFISLLANSGGVMAANVKIPFFVSTPLLWALVALGLLDQYNTVCVRWYYTFYVYMNCSYRKNTKRTNEENTQLEWLYNIGSVYLSQNRLIESSGWTIFTIGPYWL